MGVGLADIEALVLIALFTEGCGLILAGAAKRTTTAALGVNGVVFFGFFKRSIQKTLCVIASAVCLWGCALFI